MDVKKFVKEQGEKTWEQKSNQAKTARNEVLKSQKKTANIISGKRFKKQVEARSGEGRHAIVRSLGKHMSKKAMMAKKMSRDQVDMDLHNEDRGYGKRAKY